MQICFWGSNLSVSSKCYYPLPQANFQKRSNLPPPGKSFGQILVGQASLGPFILINFTNFHNFQDVVN